MTVNAVAPSLIDTGVIKGHEKLVDFAIPWAAWQGR